MRELTEKQIKLIELYNQGKTLQEIGNAMNGVTRERARQLLNKLGLKTNRNKFEGQKKIKVKKSFNDKYTIDKESGCWIWSSPKTTCGYDRVMHNGKLIRIQRLSMELHRKDFNPSLHTTSSCNNVRCVNPDHLFQVEKNYFVRKWQKGC